MNEEGIALLNGIILGLKQDVIETLENSDRGMGTTQAETVAAMITARDELKVQLAALTGLIRAVDHGLPLWRIMDGETVLGVVSAPNDDDAIQEMAIDLAVRCGIDYSETLHWEPLKVVDSALATANLNAGVNSLRERRANSWEGPLNFGED